MGFETEREQDNRLYFSVSNSNKAGEKKGIYYKDKQGNKVFVSSISGELISISKELCKPKEGSATKFEPFWQYKIELQDMQSNPTNFVLRLRRDNRTTDSLINTMATLGQMDTKLKFIPWVNAKGQLSIFVSNGKLDSNNKDISFKWKYNWDSSRGDFETIPLVVEKPLGVFDATGKEKVVYIRDERDAFLEKELQQVALLLTGKSWVNEIQGGKPLVQEQPNSNLTEADKLLNGIKANYTTQNAVLDKWSILAGRLNTSIPADEKVDLLRKIQNYLDGLKPEGSTTGYKLSLDSTYSRYEIDDLPF